MESEFYANMQIYDLCPKYLHSFTVFRAAVQEQLCLQTVHYYTQQNFYPNEWNNFKITK